ncbi:MAG: metallophosphoesterase [Candidatus Geothermarchaeales archaeon]
MLIGLISDTHDNKIKIERAVELFNTEKVDIVLHAGDHIAPFSVDWFRPLKAPLRGTAGNLDAEFAMLEKKYGENDWEFDRDILTLELEGRIALTHGTREEFVLSLAKSGEYDAVVRGHTHQRQRDLYGETLLINPGEACGYLTSTGSVALLFMPEKEVTFVEL